MHCVEYRLISLCLQQELKIKATHELKIDASFCSYTFHYKQFIEGLARLVLAKLYAYILWTNERSHSWNADYTLYLFDITHADRLFMHFTDVGHQGKVRPRLANEVEVYKLFPVSEVFRFDSQVGFCSNLNRI